MSESTDRLKAIFEGTAEIKPEDVHFDPRRDRIGGGSFGDVYRGKPSLSSFTTSSSSF